MELLRGFEKASLNNNASSMSINFCAEYCPAGYKVIVKRCFGDRTFIFDLNSPGENPDVAKDESKGQVKEKLHPKMAQFEHFRSLTVRLCSNVSALSKT